MWSVACLEGDLYEDGLALRNGFFRTRHFGQTGSEGSVDLFAEDRTLETEVDMEEDNSSQAEVLRRKDKLEREEFVRKCRVSPRWCEVSSLLQYCAWK